uniref:Phospholipase A2 n=1 Tax=Malurus cyaneus samueli TaxID=2593467 RepID=A0A8C5TWX2_9PASS
KLCISTAAFQSKCYPSNCSICQRFSYNLLHRRLSSINLISLIVSQSDCYVSLSLPTASVQHFRTKTVPNNKNPTWNETFHFTIQSQVKNILELKVCDEDNLTQDDHLLTVFFDVSKIQLGENIQLSFQLNPKVWVKFKGKVTQGLCFRPRNLDARLGFDLCTDEQNFLQNRKKVVAAALKDVLHLEEDLQDHEVPIVAVTTSGCGIRALTAMYGSILGLQKLRVLDCVSYISGSSGTTWTMTKLYEDADWSRKDLGEVIVEARKQAAKCKMGAFCLKSLRNYYRELSQRTQAGHKTSFIDLWGLMIESMLNDGVIHHRLSDQRQAVNQGQNPLPIYLALNVKDKVTTKDFREWVEFTPYEVGFLKYGAFIRAEDFGSEFFMGRLMKKLPESRICFMQGMWSSIFSKNLLDAWHAADNSEDFWHRWTQDKVTEIDLPEKPYEMATCVFTPTSGLSTTLRDILTDRPAVSKYHNFLRGFQMHNEYIQHEHFTRWKDTLLDNSPNDLRGHSDHLELVDAAFFFETSYPPLLRPDLILGLFCVSYAAAVEQPLEQACKYFAEQEIPFPCIGLTDDEKNLKECYMFDGANTPGAPLLLYFPLVNDTFQAYVAPGMERTAAEMEQGKVDISSFSSPYSTREVSLKAEDFNKLLKLTNYNIMNNENMILQALRMAVARKKQALSQHVSQAQPSA